MDNRATRSREQRLDRTLLEREEDLRVVEAACERARERRGSIVVIEGEPGLGKSRLLGEGCAAARADGMEVLTATCRELERDFAFGVALQLLEGRLAKAGEEERERLLAGSSELSLPLFGGGLADRGDAKDAFSLAHGLYWLCSNLAEEHPLLIAVDDAHWADPATLDFLLYLAQRIGELPVAVALGVGQAQPAGVLGELIAHRATSRLRLHPLSVPAVGERLRASLFPEADEALAAACHEATGGNPFLLNELALDLADRGLAADRAAAEAVRELAPEAIATAVLVRLRRLGAEALALGRALAVLGDGAELRHAAALADLDQSEAAAVANAMIEAGILRRGDELAFVHPVLRVAVYQERSGPQRADAHLRVARMLATEGASPEQIAAHLLHGRRAGDAWTVDVLLDAAARASDQGVPESAVRLLRRALTEPSSSPQRSRVLLSLGRAEAVSGEPEAEERLREALAAVDDPGDRAEAALEAGRAWMARGRHSEAVDTFQRGLRDVDGADRTLRARLEAAAMYGGILVGRQEELPEPRLPAIDRRSADRATLARLAFQRAMQGEDHADTRDLAMRALGFGKLLDDETADGLGYYLATSALTLCGDLQGAELALAAAVEDARTRGSVLGFATACHVRSQTVLERGRIDDAAADAQNALAATRYGWRLAIPTTHAVLAECLIEQGELVSAERELELAAEAAEECSWAARYLAVRARLRLLQRRPQEALEDLLEEGRRQIAAGGSNPALVPWRSRAGLAAAELGDASEGRRLVEDELSLAREFGAPGPAGRALLALASLERGKERLATLEEASRLLDKSESALDRARGLVELGASLRRSGSRRAAREPLAAGHDLATRCGARVLAQRALEEAKAAGARPREAITGVAALTPRELQVAGLAAEGMSNREIAESLFVTMKTVEWHLRHSYEKLDVSSRRELRGRLAAEAAPHGIT